jgi:hypothetical protein
MITYITSNIPARVITIMLLFLKTVSASNARRIAFAASQTSTRSMSRFGRSSIVMKAGPGQSEVILVGCGAPNRGMGWYHGIQMIEKK